jgi:hypothetical protein
VPELSHIVLFEGRGSYAHGRLFWASDLHSHPESANF